MEPSSATDSFSLEHLHEILRGGSVNVKPMKLHEILTQPHRSLNCPFQKMVSAAFVCDGARVLLARRSENKRIAPGQWHLPGGHVEEGELPCDALSREILEELAVRVSVDRLIHVFEYGEIGQKTLGFVFAATLLDSPSQIMTDPVDTKELVWATRDQLDSLFADKGHNHVAALKGFKQMLGT